MNRQLALMLIEDYLNQYSSSPSEFHRGFAMGIARFALESNFITTDEYISYCDKINEVIRNDK